MKKTLLLAAFAAIAFISCQKNETPAEEPTGDPVEVSTGIPMKLVAEIPAPKVSYTPDGNVLKASWEATETISVVTLDGTGDGARVVAIDNFTSTGAAGRAKAEFTGTFTGGNSPACVIVIYPALSESGGGKYATDSYTDHTSAARSVLYDAAVGSEYIQANFQALKQTSDNDASHLENYCVITGNVDIDDIKNNLLTASLSHEMTVLKVTATFPSAAKGQTLTEMDIEAYNSTNPTYSYMARDHSWNYVNLPVAHLVCSGSGYNKITKLYCNFPIPDTGVATLYFVNCRFADQAIGNKWKFTAHVGAGLDTYVAEKTFKAAASFDKGSIYRVSASLSYVPAGALKGKFTINAGGDQVYFSKGNLQATTTDSGENWTWSFAENQYDCPGGTGSSCDNLNITNEGKSSVANCTVGLFGWSTNDNTYFGINSSKTNTDWDGSFVDWGTMSLEGTPANTWRTPTSSEFSYLLKTRTTSTVCGTENARFARATVNSVEGNILFPDAYTHPAGVADIVNINVKDAANNGNTISASDWEKMEAAGAVFLPQAGYYDATYPTNIYDGRGYYWTSSSDNTTMADYYLQQASNVDSNYAGERCDRHSVRLIHDID